MSERKMYELERQKKAFLWSYDSIALYKKMGAEEKEQGIEASLLVAQRSSDITLQAFIEIVRFAYSD